MNGKLVKWAHQEAQRHLAATGDRWVHTRSVAHSAATLMHLVPVPDRELLVAAAYLHDIGYAPQIAATGFHPLDGARYLERAGQPRLASLVAHHTGARYEAAFRGLAHHLDTYPQDHGRLAAILTYIDLTSGPRGQSMTPGERFHDIENRYGHHDIVTMALRDAWPELQAQVNLVQDLCREYQSALVRRHLAHTRGDSPYRHDGPLC